MTDAQHDNAVHAMLGAAPSLCADLAIKNSNSGEPLAGATWALKHVGDMLRENGSPDSPWQAFDFAVWDVEAMEAIWPTVAYAIKQHEQAWEKPEGEIRADLADFIFRRYGAALKRRSDSCKDRPASKALAIADRLDTLAGFASIGQLPNGSKDPYALRRAAWQLWWWVIPSPTVGDMQKYVKEQSND